MSRVSATLRSSAAGTNPPSDLSNSPAASMSCSGPTPGTLNPPASSTSMSSGRTCQTTDLVCPTPTSGQIVPNGVYIVQLLSTEPSGNLVTVSGSLVVAHGEIQLISEVTPVPNPVAADADQVWVTYKVPVAGVLAGLDVKVYNVAGELVRRIEGAALGGADTDPLGLDGRGTFKWDMRNQSGSRCSAGLYVIVIDASDLGGTIQRTITKLAIQ